MLKDRFSTELSNPTKKLFSYAEVLPEDLFLVCLKDCQKFCKSIKTIPCVEFNKLPDEIDLLEQFELRHIHSGLSSKVACTLWNEDCVNVPFTERMLCWSLETKMSQLTICCMTHILGEQLTLDALKQASIDDKDFPEDLVDRPDMFLHWSLNGLAWCILNSEDESVHTYYFPVKIFGSRLFSDRAQRDVVEWMICTKLEDVHFQPEIKVQQNYLYSKFCNTVYACIYDLNQNNPTLKSTMC